MAATQKPIEFQHHPTLKEEDSGLYCFKDQSRVCNQSCMAWCARPAGKDFEDQQFANCLLLVNAHRTGKHLVLITNTLANIERRYTAPGVPTVQGGR